jgi:UDP-N-acetylglucosamine 2-epimerase (non-hydrolysing)
MKILHVVGARPNFMKLAPVREALGRHAEIRQCIVHTGQHYDASMSEVFFRDLDLPDPDVNLEIGSGSHAEQTARTMLALESRIRNMRPDLVLVYGDVNSTLAAALVCSKLCVSLGHVEAGLRSFDRTMPEEVNRVLTDQISDLLFTPSNDANENLCREGIPRERVHFVGNVMIDTLVKLRPKALRFWKDGTGKHFENSAFILVTLHRPVNVDDEEVLARILQTLREISCQIRVLWPVHPRTRRKIQDMEFQSEGLELLEPLGYLEFLALQNHAIAVVTDSGGVQEETTFLDVPCLTLRDSTERPITITLGTNRLVGTSSNALLSAVRETLAEGRRKNGTRPPLWDGRAGERIADVVMKWSRSRNSTSQSTRAQVPPAPLRSVARANTK